MPMSNNRVIRGLACSAAIGATLALASTAWAGSIDYLSNQSSDYIRSFSRNAATYGGDIINYNPAGTAFWEHDGLYLNLHTQTIFKDYYPTWEGEEYHSTVPTPILPTFFTGFKIDNFVVFGSFTVPAGGGSLQYDKGVPYLAPLVLTVDDADANKHKPANAYFEGSSMYLAPTIGVAYKFFDLVSIAAAGRLVFADKEFKGHATYGTAEPKLDANKFAMGATGIFSIHFQPFKQLDLAIRYELETGLEWETESNLEAGCSIDCPGLLKTASGDNPNALWSYADGAKENRNLPAVLGAGIAYHPLPDLTISTSFQYYFIKDADDKPDEPGNQGYVRSYDDDYDDGWDLAFAVEGKVIPELLLSIGYNRSDLGGNKDTMSDFEYGLDSHSVGLGGRWAISQYVSVTAALSMTLYEEGENDTLHPLLNILPPYYTGPNGTIDPQTLVAGETFNKQVFDLAFGVEYRPPL